MTPDPSDDRPIGSFDRGNPARRCTAHKKNGEQCRHWARRGTSVCDWHGAKAPQVKAKARLRLEMASDRLARELLNMTTDPNVSDPVKLAAIKDALDRGGIQSKNAVSVEVGITKPFEAVFDSIISGPRDSAASPALAALECPGEDTEVIEGEYDDDPFPEDDEVIHSGYTDAEPDVIDVEIEAIGSGPLTPDDPSSSLSVDLSGPLIGPPGSGLMTLEQANEVAATMRARANTRSARWH